MLNKAKKMTFLLLAIVLWVVPSMAFASDGIGPLVVANYGSGIAANGTTISVTAFTQSFQIEDIISVTSTLQVKNGSSWSNVYTWPTVSATNTNYVPLSKSYVGTSGKTYRVTSTHYTKKGATSDTKTSYSSAVTAR